MRPVSIALVLLFACIPASAQVAQSTAFTYQGQLRQAGVAVNGARNLAFALFDAASEGNQLGTTIEAAAWPIVDGLFTVDLSFPGQLTVEQRWLEVRVEGQPMLPRHPITAAPVAQFALVGAPGPPGPQGPPGIEGFPGSVTAAACDPGDALREIREGGFRVACETSGLHGWTRPSTDLSIRGGGRWTEIVRCPADAVVIGGGVEALDRRESGFPRYTTLRILESFPTFDGGRWAWQVGLYNTDGVSIRLRAFAVCALT